MKKIYLNRMEKKTWNHININEKVMTVPYIQFKENEEIIESINDRIRKIPNPGNYTRKDQEHENNSINNVYVIEKIEEAEETEKKEKENLKQENSEEILNNGKNTEHKRRYVYGKDLIQEYGKDYFLDDEEINRIIQNSNINISDDKNEKIKDHKYRKNIEEIIISKDKEEKIVDIINDGILLSNTRITLRKNISAKYVLNICEEVENTYRDNNIIIKAEENSNFEVVIIFNENKSNFALDSIYVEAGKNAKVNLLYVFLGSGNQMIKHVTRVEEKAKVDIKGIYLLRKR
ncbi:MAG: SufD family Fe-S cluster assembly protein [Clostridiales bacterium]|nr:SufD family Fe-S cluster assembly protein [Clostridiales bacterium]